MVYMVNKKNEKIYEVGLHIIPTIEDDKVSTVFEDLKNSVVENAEVLSAEDPERRDLAYTIRHAVRRSDGSYERYDASYFGSIKFRASQEGVQKVRQSFQGNEQVLRFVILETAEEDTRIGDDLPGEEKDDVVSKEEGGAEEGKDAVSSASEVKEKDSEGGGGVEAGDKK